MIFNRIAIIAMAICSLSIAGVVGYNDYCAYSHLSFVIDLETSASGISQVFYDAGKGYNEADSCSIAIQNGTSQKYTFSPLPSKLIRSIRFDPINVPAVVRIKDARIENRQGDIVKKFPLQDFRSIQQIDKMDVRDGKLVIHTLENANDPIIEIENSSIKDQYSWNDYIAKRGWIIIGCGLLSLLIMIFLNYFVIFAGRHEHAINNALQHREALLMGLLGLWGVIILVLTPPFQVPDEFAHYNRAFQVSEFTMMSVKQGNLLGGMLPEIIQLDQVKFKLLPFFAERKLSFNQYLTMIQESPAMTSKSLAKRDFFDFANTALYPPLPYLFSGLGIAVSRFFSMTVLNGFYMARLFNLLAVIGFIYCAMQLLRRLPELQLMLFLIAGMPMMTFELMSLSADSITFSLAVLVFACVVNLSLEWNRRAYVILVASSVLLGLCKQTYAFLPCISFVFWKSIPESFFKKIIFIALVIASAIVPTLLWSKYAQNIYVPHRKGMHIDPIAQWQYFINNWHILMPYFLKDIFYKNLRIYIHTMYGSLGWLDTPLPDRNAAFYICLCFASVLVLLQRKKSSLALNAENNDNLVLPLGARFFLLMFLLISVLIIAISIYLSWNVVGAVSLEGIQGRYFIPLLPFLLLAFYSLLPIRLTKPYYLSWLIFCLGAWAYFSWQAVSILYARYWVA